MDRLRAIESFVRIVDKGSLTAAAADLAMSLPSMVRTLAGLERELGTTLLNRTTRKLHLTYEGTQYLEHCRIILAQLHEAETKMQSRHAVPTGRLSITASVLFGQLYVAPIVNEFVQRYPGVTADMLFLDRVVNLVEEGLDAAVRIGHLGDTSLIAIPLGRVRRVVCASPGYLRKHGVPKRPDDLRDHRCVRFTGLAPRSDWFFRLNSRSVSVPIQSLLTCNLAESAIKACASGLGMGCFLSYMVAPLKRAGKLRYVLEEFEIEPLPVQFVYARSRALSTAVRTLADLCVTKLRSVELD